MRVTRPVLKQWVPDMVLTAVLVALLSGCAPKTQESLVASVGPTSLTLPDYERMYLKSNTSKESAAKTTQEEREKFLDLMVKYQLKLAAAYDEGLDRRPDVTSEIEQYKGSLAASYLTEREVVAPGLKDLYARRSEEIRASHILLELNSSGSPADSAATYQKAYQIIAEAKAGADFGALAVSFSKDPSVSRNRGDLYYFTAGVMVPVFEDAVYKLKIGEVTPNPVRTQYGLHIIKVTDRRPAPGDTRCAHIMIRFSNPNPTPEDTAAAYAKIRPLADSVAMGGDFAELARRHSEDPGSATRGGDLGWFTRRRYVIPFDEAALVLKPGEVSRIIRTPFGYHIIKCLETRPPKSFDEAKADLQQMYQQMRFQNDYRAYIDKLKTEVQFTRNDSVVAQMRALLDSTKTVRDSAWAAGVTPELRRSTVFTVLGKPVSVDSVIHTLQSRMDISNSQLRSTTFAANIDKVGEQLMFAARATSLERENPEFASILKEYKEGILLYQVEQENVWGKIQSSDSLLHAYFDSHRDKFTFPDRVTFTEARTFSEQNGQALYAKVNTGMSLEAVAKADSIRMAAPTKFDAVFKKKSASLTPAAAKLLASLAEQMKADTLLRVFFTARPDTSKQKQTAWKLASRRTETLSAKLISAYGISSHRVNVHTQPQAASRARQDTVGIELTGKQALIVGKLSTSTVAPAADERAKRTDSLAIGKVSAPFFARSSWLLVRLDGREPTRQKTYDEAGAEVSTSYQDYESKRLESLWVDRLRAKYPVVEHKEALKNAFVSH